jgi:hypothetical protein
MSTPLLAAFARQAQWCREGEAPFSARVLEATAAWLAEHPVSHDEIAAVADDPGAAAVPLRLLAGLHRVALQGRRPWSALWPPDSQLGDEPDDEHNLRVAIAHAWHFQGALLRQALENPPQTNEVQRSAALLPGLLHVAARTGMPLALLEIGASAGLNLWADHYRVETPSFALGPADATLVLRPEWRGPPPPQAPLAIEHRAGCDLRPVDLLQEGEDERLASYIWAEQAERLERLRQAVAIARARMAAEGVRIAAARAPQFLRQQLTLRLPGQALVLMHSVVWQYLPAAEQQAVAMLMQAAGEASTSETPLAWLRFEPTETGFAVELRCRRWPGGEDQLLARCHPHGAWIEWLA